MSSSDSPEFPQGTLIVPDVLEVRWLIGIVRSADVLAQQIEVRSGTDGQLLSMISKPYAPLTQAEAQLALYYEALLAKVLPLAHPFT